MATHVDIIRNEPLAGTSHILARIILSGGTTLDLETRGTDKEEMWRFLRSRVAVDPSAEPARFLNALPDAIDSTYVIASRVHDDVECPYVHPMDAPQLH